MRRRIIVRRPIVPSLDQPAPHPHRPLPGSLVEVRPKRGILRPMPKRGPIMDPRLPSRQREIIGPRKPLQKHPLPLRIEQLPPLPNHLQLPPRRPRNPKPVQCAPPLLPPRHHPSPHQKADGRTPPPPLPSGEREGPIAKGNGRVRAHPPRPKKKTKKKPDPEPLKEDPDPSQPKAAAKPARPKTPHPAGPEGATYTSPAFWFGTMTASRCQARKAAAVNPTTSLKRAQFSADTARAGLES